MNKIEKVLHIKMKISTIMDLILGGIYSVVGVFFSVFLIWYIINGNNPQLPSPDPFSAVIGFIFLIPSALLAKRGIMLIYNLYKEKQPYSDD